VDLYRQLSDLPLFLRVGPDDGAHDDWRVYLRRYQWWTEKAVDPSLVQGVFIWETSTSGEPRLLKYNLKNETLDQVAIPAGRQTLLARLQATSTDMPTAFRAWEAKGASQSSLTLLPTAPRGTVGWQFDPNTPAVAHPIFHTSSPGKTNAGRPVPVDWLIVIFDWSRIETDLIPRLADRYFGNPEGLQFKVAVVSAVKGTPTRVLYSSDPGFGRSSAVDATMNIFGPEPQSLESGAWQPTARQGSNINATDWHHVSGLLWFPVIRYPDETQSWELRLQHRQDSLDAVIAGVRRRNFLVGLGVLGVLAAAIIMLLVASYCAQTLSKLQIQFVGSVSHELRTPLAVLSSATENIADGIVQDKSRLEQYRSMMRKQIRQLSEIVDHVLLFAATTEYKPRYSTQAVYVHALVQAVVNDLHGYIEQSGTQMRCSIPTDLAPVWADPAVLSQCLQTLIVNAIKYSGQNRWVGIEAKFVLQDTGDEEVQITLRDLGIGIKESELRHIFKPFYRSPAVIAANIHGSGLGLSLAKQLIDAMGGEVTVASELGKGSAFTLHLRTAPGGVPTMQATPVTQA